MLQTSTYLKFELPLYTFCIEAHNICIFLAIQVKQNKRLILLEVGVIQRVTC